MGVSDSAAIRLASPSLFGHADQPTHTFGSAFPSRESTVFYRVPKSLLRKHPI